MRQIDEKTKEFIIYIYILTLALYYINILLLNKLQTKNKEIKNYEYK